MAQAPQKRCTRCKQLHRGRCDNCRRANYRRQNKLRPTDPFYSSAAWRKLRAVRLAEEPLCRFCFEKGRIVAARAVDHIVPRNSEGGSELELDYDNTRSLCVPCHNRRTAQDRDTHRGGGHV